MATGRASESTRNWPLILVEGSTAGVVATFAMSAVMLGLQRLGLLGRTPPRHIVEHALTRLGMRRAVSPRSKKAMSVVAHLGFGGVQGALYAIGNQAVAALNNQPSRPVTPATAVPFALAVWAASYAGWIPAFGILPPPSRDRFGRPTSMVVAHVAYGMVLARALGRHSRHGRTTAASFSNAIASRAPAA